MLTDVSSYVLITISVVDDLLPVSRDGTLMCTFSTNHEELWAPIIEKAVSSDLYYYQRKLLM
jgi:hypothetical protein